MGAEWTKDKARRFNYVNLVAPTYDDARKTMIEGESGIMNICSNDERPVFKKNDKELIWPNGSKSLLFTADEPERFRGKQHFHGWADELAAWRYEDSWTQFKFGMRLGSSPQICITTTPKPRRLITDLINDPDTVVTTGSSYDNRANLAPTFFDSLVKEYEGTRLGEQELYAKILTDTPGALWKRDNLDEQRVNWDSLPEMARICVSVDPAVSSNDRSNETGIIAVGLGSDQRLYVLDDQSGIYSPAEWSAKAVSLLRMHEGDFIVAEINQGGNLVTNAIHTYDRRVAVRDVRATRGKYIRAEPASALYEQRRVSHVGSFPELEEQMCAFTVDYDRRLQGRSPDRVDALVWAITALLPETVRTRRAVGVKKPSRRDIGGSDGWMTG